MNIIFREHFIFQQFFFSPQMKLSEIISNKHDTYELPNDHEKF